MKRLVLLSLLTACGGVKDDPTAPPQTQQNNERISELSQKILALEGTTSQLSALVASDFASCPNSGETADALINKICKVAQAATVESRVELAGRLASATAALESKLSDVSQQAAALSEDIDAAEIDIATLEADVADVVADVSALDSRLDTAESAIDALEALTASISGSINGSMTAVEVGSENVGAGPVYESLLRRVDKTRINAYVEAFGSANALAANPFNATNGSSTVTVTLTGHGLSVGDSVVFSGLTSGRGFGVAQLNREMKVVTVPTANTFTVDMMTNATSGGTLGGNVGSFKKVLGRGMGNIWKTADGADVAVRTTSLGTKRYNFIVQADGDVCYSDSDNAANFATINAGGAGIVCK